MQVFEQDAHAFTRRLNGILAPGPMCYVAKIDAFVVGNSEMGVDCYKYQVLQQRVCSVVVGGVLQCTEWTQAGFSVWAW